MKLSSTPHRLPADRFPPAQEIFYTSFDGGISAKTFRLSPVGDGFWKKPAGEEFWIPRGAGLSYAAASFSPSAITVEHTGCNRILSLDAARNIVEVEAGVTLGALFRFLVPKGLFLPIQPGHPAITIGGCVAADVHGKNQFLDGTFISQVQGFTLFHSTHGIIEADEKQNPELFKLTCGGYGLTGNLLRVKLRVKNIPSPFAKVRVTRIRELGNLAGQLEEAAGRSELVYTWHNFTARGEKFGRGFLFEGGFSENTNSEAPFSATRNEGIVSGLKSETRGNLRFPFFNSFTTPWFNRVYGLATQLTRKELEISIFDFIFPVHDKQIYFKLFGTKGFFEYQAIIPTAAFPDYVHAVREFLFRERTPVTLASAKIFRGRDELLRFTGEGVCFALNFPQGRKGAAFMKFLDQLIMELGGKPNIIKDSRLPREVVDKTYPEAELFRQKLRKFDPKRLYRSELSERLNL